MFEKYTRFPSIPKVFERTSTLVEIHVKHKKLRTHGDLQKIAGHS